jgi:hypothetical protein
MHSTAVYDSIMPKTSSIYLNIVKRTMFHPKSAFPSVAAGAQPTQTSCGQISLDPDIAWISWISRISTVWDILLDILS